MGEVFHHALKEGTWIEEFEILDVLGVGGFSITYKGYDHNNRRDVAIKEYLPTDLAVRSKDDTTIQPISEGGKSDYFEGLNRFINEARALTRFREPTIIHALRFVLANGTAYLIMEYADGQALNQYLESRGGTLTEKEVMQILEPILQGLKVIHKGNYLHRDIKPGNIYRRANGEPVLIDFGAARQHVDDGSHAVTRMVTSGYTPFEQYNTREKQGPWTDIYALGATLYRCIAGRHPPDALERIAALHNQNEDPLLPAMEIGRGRYPMSLLETIDWMLSPLAQNRPQNVDMVIDALANQKGIDTLSTYVASQVAKYLETDPTTSGKGPVAPEYLEYLETIHGLEKTEEIHYGPEPSIKKIKPTTPELPIQPPPTGLWASAHKGQLIATTVLMSFASLLIYSLTKSDTDSPAIPMRSNDGSAITESFHASTTVPISSELGNKAKQIRRMLAQANKYIEQGKEDMASNVVSDLLVLEPGNSKVKAIAINLLIGAQDRVSIAKQQADQLEAGTYAATPYLQASKQLRLANASRQKDRLKQAIIQYNDSAKSFQRAQSLARKEKKRRGTELRRLTAKQLRWRKQTEAKRLAEEKARRRQFKKEP
ncbi:MAG TPA: hypothetical protein ENI80_01540 [Acidiferrobacteraceae bacterium]|nr:hypothetical protein [Acidiferrobacteraceae bacterium]